jgi:hypothetical protein
MINVVANFMLKKMSKPLTPEEVIEKQKGILTNWMIDYINTRLLNNFDGTKAFIKKEHVKNFIQNKGYNYEAFRENGGLKFESVFSEFKWQVTEDEEGWTFRRVTKK